MKKVLLTGAGGFLGNAVVKQLSKLEGYETIAVVSGRRPVTFSPDIHVEAVNLLDENARSKLLGEVQPDIILHLAWCQTKKEALASHENVEWLEASLHLCRLFHQNGGSRFIFAGTGFEYGVGSSGNTEEYRKTEYSLYGRCKLAFEQVAEDFLAHNHVEFASARYFSLYGPGDDRLGHAIPHLISAMMTGNRFYCLSPRNVWDFTYIDDAAEATVKLMQSNYCGAMNIASGCPYMVKDVFSMVAELTGHPELLELNSESTEFRICPANVERMQSVLNYCCATPVREGLEKTIQWWRGKLASGDEK